MNLIENIEPSNETHLVETKKRRKGKSSIVEPNWQTESMQGIDFYLHYEVSIEDLVEALFEKVSKEPEGQSKVRLLKRLRTSELSTLGKISYKLSKGMTLPQDTHDYFKNRLTVCLEKAEYTSEASAAADTKNNKNAETQISIQDRMAKQLTPLIARWEDSVLDADTFNVEAFQPQNDMAAFKPEIKGKHALLIKEHFEPFLQEALEVQKFENEDIKEAFENTTPEWRTQQVQLYDKIVRACDSILGTAKASRKARKKRAPNLQKMVAKVKYMVNEPTLGLASVSPLDIVGATEVWVYNPKKRQLGAYYADPHGGALSLRRSMIVGFDERTSIGRKVRKVEKHIKEMSQGVQSLRRVFKSLKATDKKLSGRLSKDVLILKTYK